MKNFWKTTFLLWGITLAQPCDLDMSKNQKSNQAKVLARNHIFM